MQGEILKHTGRLANGSNIKEMIENANMADGEFILFYDDQKGKFRVFTNQDLVDIGLKEAGF